jgi:hypothetical protein
MPARPAGAAGEAAVERVPPTDDGLAALPAQPHLAAGNECREVDQAVLDVAQRQTQGIDPRDAGGHLVDESLHPQPGQAEVVDERRVPGSGRSFRDGGRGPVAAAGTTGEDLVAEAHEFGPLLDEHGEDPVELGDGGVGGVEVVEAGHPAAILAPLSPIIAMTPPGPSDGTRTRLAWRSSCAGSSCGPPATVG